MGKKKLIIFILLFILLSSGLFLNRSRNVSVVNIKDDVIVYKRHLSVPIFELRQWELKLLNWVDIWPDSDFYEYGIMNNNGEVLYQNIDGYEFIGDKILIRINDKIQVVSKSHPPKVIKEYHNIYLLDTFIDYKVYRLKNQNKDILIGYDGNIIELESGFTSYGTGGRRFVDEYLFVNGYAIVEKDEQKGVINLDGHFVIEPHHNYLSQVNQNETLITCDTKSFYSKFENCDVVNLQDDVVKHNIDSLYDYEIQYYLDSIIDKHIQLRIDESDNLYGLIGIDTQNLSVPHIFDQIESLTVNGKQYYKVIKDDLIGILDVQGNVMISVSYDDVMIQNLGNDQYAFLATSNDSKDSLYNLEGNVIVSYDTIYGYVGDHYLEIKLYPFYPLIFKVENEGQYGFVNSNGKQITTISYDDALIDSHLKVLKDHNWYVSEYIKRDYYLSDDDNRARSFLMKDGSIINTKKGNIYLEDETGQEQIYNKYFIYQFSQMNDILIPLIYGFVYTIILYSVGIAIWNYRQNKKESIKELQDRLDL